MEFLLSENMADISCVKLFTIMLMFAGFGAATDSPDRQTVVLEYYAQQNKLLIELLLTEGCPLPRKQKTSLRTNDPQNIKMEVQQQLYEELGEELSVCRAGKHTTSVYTKTPTSTKTATPTSTPQPTPCQSAINLTESWRKDHSDSGIKPINGKWNCDNLDMVAAGRPWFRFSGAAGNRLLDHCVQSGNHGGSCGTHAALWSNDPMPNQIGVVTSIEAYGSYWGNCKRPGFTRQCHVIRCSDKPHDYVYRLANGLSNCPLGFCGMD